MTSCHLQSNYSSAVTLHGGPVVLRPVRATPYYNHKHGVCVCVFRSSTPARWSDHRLEGERALAGAGVAAAARRRRLSGRRLRGRDDGERQRRTVGQGRLRVEPRDEVHGGRPRRGSQLLLPRVCREPSRVESTAAVRLRHAVTAARYVELVLFFRSSQLLASAFHADNLICLSGHPHRLSFLTHANGCGGDGAFTAVLLSVFLQLRSPNLT